MTLRAGSLFSGGGFMDYAVESAGFQVTWQFAIDPDARAGSLTVYLGGERA
jgi:site-specific DNA-cytosine methylase